MILIKEMLKYSILTILLISQLINSNLAVKCNTTDSGIKQCDYCMTLRVTDLRTGDYKDTITCEIKTCEIKIMLSDYYTYKGASMCCTDHRCYSPNMIPVDSEGRQTKFNYCEKVTMRDGSSTTKCSNNDCKVSTKIDINGKWISKSKCCSNDLCFEPKIELADKQAQIFEDIPIFQKGCPNNWLPFQGNCYKSFNEKYNYTQARWTCLGKNNSDLVTITSKEEQQFFLQQGLTKHNQYIGLYEMTDENEFSWVDGGALSYSNWENGQPDVGKDKSKECVEMTTTGRWRSINCMDKIGFMCKYKML